MTEICVGLPVVDQALPMAMIVTTEGRVRHVAPTLERIAPGGTGRMLGEVLRFLRPALSADPAEMLSQVGRRLTVEMREERNIAAGESPSRMRAIVAPLQGGDLLLNLSFGTDVARGVKRHTLTAQDFAATDPTVELLFLMEAQAAVLTEFRNLSDRLEEARETAEEEAVTDKLTGLRNRRAMDTHLGRLARQQDARFGLMHLDLDYFKSVNDTFGHAAGDRVLEQVAHILREEVRRGDMVARVGGDEFILVIDNCGDVELLERISERIISRLEQPMEWQGKTLRISGSIGLTMSSFYDPVDPDRLMSDADEALYASKNGGRSRHSVANPSRSSANA